MAFQSQLKPLNTQALRRGLAPALLLWLSGTALTASAEIQELNGQAYIQSDRYTLVSIETRPEQISPLLAVVDIQFSKNIQTVGDAIEELLIGSGYRWNTTQNETLQSLPLPVVVRQIGPVRLRDALVTMAGTAWSLRIDEATRTIQFVPAGSDAPVPVATAPGIEEETI